jgi:hypothetical protein
VERRRKLDDPPKRPMSSIYKPEPLTVVDLPDARSQPKKFDVDAPLPLGVCIIIWTALAGAGWGLVYLLFQLI